MTYSVSTIYLLTIKILDVALITVYLFSPLILITIIQLNAGLKNKLTKAINKVAILLIMLCVNKAFLIYSKDSLVFNGVELVLLVMIQWHISKFYFNMSTFKRKRGLYTYGIKVLLKELKLWLTD